MRDQLTSRFTFTVYRCGECGRTYDVDASRGLAPMCAGRAGMHAGLDRASHEPAQCDLLTVAPVLDGDCPKCGTPMTEDDEETCAPCAGGVL